MGRLLPILVGAALLALLAYFCIDKHGPEIEADVGGRANAAVVAAGVGGVNVTADGRDLTLRGIVANDALRQKAGATARDEYGVRVVDNDLYAADAINGLALIADGGKIILRGTVPDQATKDAWLAKARELYGADKVVDELKVLKWDMGVPSFRDAMLAALPWLGKLTSGRVEAGWKSLKVDGSATYYDLPAQIRAALARLGAEVNVDMKGVVIPPVIVVKRCQGDTDALLEGEMIQFDSGKATIKPESKALIDKLGKALAICSDAAVRIEGHTDTDGEADFNQKLSERRAEAVKKALVKRGAQAANITTVGFGQTKPIGDNETPEGRAQNRRIEFKMEVSK